MDAGSLDAAVQSALQALYPPFEATAPTVLGQVFRLLETSYQGDGLCCLLQFLIPAKRLFERLRQAACAPYFNRIFLHEGWPLCLHEKVVVHLAPLNPLLLRPGDFYLQAEPCEEHTARVTIKHLSLDLRSVEETPVPEATHALLFTNTWLEEVNNSWAGAPLHTCLVATENGVTPLPWSRIATPEFTDKPRAEADSVPAGTWHESAPESAPGTLVLHGTVNVPTPYSNVVGTIPGCKATSRKSSQGRYPGLIKVEQAGLRKKPATLPVPSLSEIISQNLEGEYVDLLEQSQEDLDILTRSLLPTCLPGTIKAGADEMLPWANGASGADSWPCGGALSSEERPCSPCLGREISQEPESHGPKCRQRDSYMAALQNPVSFGSSHKFSFLKGTRLGAAPEDEKTSSQHEGAWKKMSAIYSPRMGRAKAAGKGTNAATAAPVEERSLESSSCKNGPSVPSTGPAGREPPAWQNLHAGLLRSGIICLPGSSDRLGRALLLVTTSGSAWRAAWCSAAELARLILCLCSLPRREAKDAGLTVVVDARKQPPAPVLFSALRSVQSVSPGCIHSLLLLAEKELVSHREKLPGVQVEILTSLKALGRHVDSSQLPPELDGAFPYCHGEWVQFFQVSVTTP
uniref:KIAA1755 n=1 Tax=Zonotrichia albicollis TaxID=44394 RepID=A0A8D2M7B2_ZONAL